MSIDQRVVDRNLREIGRNVANTTHVRSQVIDPVDIAGCDQAIVESP